MTVVPPPRTRQPSLFPGAGWRTILLAGIATFAVAFVGFLAAYLRYPALQDTDSYYHLALAREIAGDGLPDRLEWARFTPLAERFGDPVLGFHLLIAPFAAGADPEVGAVWVLALLDATIVGLLAAFAVAAVGPWGALLPAVVFLGSTEALFRLVRLRPELLALVILVAAAWLIGRRAYRWLGLAAALYALSYSAVHAFAALVVGCFVVMVWRRGRPALALPLYGLGGLGLGLVVHPQFPANLASFVGTLGVGLGGGAVAGSGPELLPHATSVALFTQLGCWLAALVTWLARTPARGSTADDLTLAAETRDALAVFAVTFLLLYATAARFVLFALPFAGLALLWSLAARGERIGPSFPWFGRRLPTVLGYALAALVAALPLAMQLPRFAARASTGPDQVRLADRRAVAALLPAGARVAATWGTAGLFVFYAPQARYLEILDPSPMAQFFPAASAAKLRVFAGNDPDPVFTVASELASDYLLTSRTGGDPGVRALERQLRADPRVVIRHAGINLLAQLVAGQNQGFVLDWVAATEPAQSWAAAVPPAAGVTPYPRPAAPQLRALEAYVDLHRLATATPALDGPCLALRSEVQVPAGVARAEWRFASSGPAELWWNETLLLRTGGVGPARLDEAPSGVVALAEGADRVRLAVRSCRLDPAGSAGASAADAPPARGFYLELAATPGS